MYDEIQMKCEKVNKPGDRPMRENMQGTYTSMLWKGVMCETVGSKEGWISVSVETPGPDKIEEKGDRVQGCGDWPGLIIYRVKREREKSKGTH